MDERVPAASTPVEPAPAERGWGKLLIAIAAFLLIPNIPQVRAVLPIEQMMVLFVPAVAACTLVGWWAGGRAYLAVAWVAIATLLTARSGATPSAFDNLMRGWTLLLAGSFGLVCLLFPRRPLFSRALIALGTTLLLATVMTLVGPVSATQASKTVAAEFARRNAETTSMLSALIQ